MDVVRQEPLLTELITRDVAMIWSQEIEDGGVVEVYEGEEPVDVIANFLISEFGLEEFDDRQEYQEQILDIACSEIYCTRSRALVWTESIALEDGMYVGEVEVLEGDEPIDAIHNFATKHGLSVDYREGILQMCCEVLECERVTPQVYSKTINNEHGEIIGDLKVFEGDELVDNVVRFLIDNAMSADIVQMKNYFFDDACGRYGIVCTRNVAVLYERGFNLGLDEEEGEKKLVITEVEDPVDKIWSWITNHLSINQSPSNHDQRLKYFTNIKKVICSDPSDETLSYSDNRYVKITCLQGKIGPLVFGPQVITGPDGGAVGELSIHLGEVSCYRNTVLLTSASFAAKVPPAFFPSLTPSLFLLTAH